ncbi:hypothetical protein SVAN01_10534 [Stagonosporopsis vannaccii]|nr:hypothetical protein SVAN01_10534 [Stagonosporopsis vannaccii]
MTANSNVPFLAKERSQLDIDTPDEIEVHFESLPRKPDHTTIFLLSFYWLAWLLTVTSDLLLSIRRQFFPGSLIIKSPIVRYIYTHYIYRWPHGGYYILDPFFTQWGPTIVTTSFASSTVCTTLQLGLVGHLRPFRDDVVDAGVALWLALCLIVASWTGLTRHECGIIVLPFAWLSARTVQVACLRRGVYPVEIDKRRGKAAFSVGMVVLGAVYVRVLGLAFDFIAAVLFVETGWMVWSWVVGRSGGPADVIIEEDAS